MIEYKCECGKSYKLEDGLAGKKVRCSSCGKDAYPGVTPVTRTWLSPAILLSSTSCILSLVALITVLGVRSSHPSHIDDNGAPSPRLIEQHAGLARRVDDLAAHTDSLQSAIDKNESRSAEGASRNGIKSDVAAVRKITDLMRKSYGEMQISINAMIADSGKARGTITELATKSNKADERIATLQRALATVLADIAAGNTKQDKGIARLAILLDEHQKAQAQLAKKTRALYSAIHTKDRKDMRLLDSAIVKNRKAVVDLLTLLRNLNTRLDQLIASYNTHGPHHRH